MVLQPLATPASEHATLRTGPLLWSHVRHTLHKFSTKKLSTSTPWRWFSDVISILVPTFGTDTQLSSKGLVVSTPALQPLLPCFFCLFCDVLLHLISSSFCHTPERLLAYITCLHSMSSCEPQSQASGGVGFA